MPWRKTWINPAEFEGREAELKRVLSKRAYEVWVSEVSEYDFWLGWCWMVENASTRSHVVNR